MTAQRIALLFFAVLLLSSSTQAASPEYLWSHSAGGSEFDRGTAVAIDADGNSFSTGSFRSTVNFGGGDLSSAGEADVFIAKYDAEGVHQWSKGVGGTDDEVGISVAVDAAGNVLLTGAFKGSVDFGGGELTTPTTATDIFIAKYDADGVHQWSKSFGGTSTDLGYAIAVDGNGDVLLTGLFSGTVDFGGGALVSAGAYDGFLVKFDGDGVHQWSQRLGGAEHDWTFAIAVDVADNIILTGFFEGTTDLGGGDLVSAGAVDIFVAKYDSGGVHQWSQRFGGAESDQGYRVATDATGSVVLTGWFKDVVDFGGGELVSAGGDDVFLAKLDASGDHQWSQRFGGTENDHGVGLAVDTAGSAILTGNFRNAIDFGGGELFTVGEGGIYLAKFDTSGSHLWSRSYGDEGGGSGRYVALDASDNVIITGSFSGSVDFGGGDLSSSGDDDIFIAKFGEPQISVAEHLDIKPGSCPNPLNVKNLPKGSGHPGSNRGGVLPVSLFGSAEFDLTEVDLTTLELEGVAPVRNSLEDVGAPAARENDCDCMETAPDGHMDLVLKFKKADVVDALGEVRDGDLITLTLSGQLLDGSSWEWSDCVLIRGSKHEDGPPPENREAVGKVTLSAAKPNPFNPSTTIQFDVMEASRVRISIYDAAGRRVRLLMDGERSPGQYDLTWYGTDDAGRPVASGTYFVVLDAGEFRERIKVALIK